MTRSPSALRRPSRTGRRGVPRRRGASPPAPTPARSPASASLFALLAALSWRNWGVPSVDAGHELTVAAAITEGRQPYGDIRYFYGPVGVYSLAGAFAALRHRLHHRLRLRPGPGGGDRRRLLRSLAPAAARRAGADRDPRRRRHRLLGHALQLRPAAHELRHFRPPLPAPDPALPLARTAACSPASPPASSASPDPSSPPSPRSPLAPIWSAPGASTACARRCGAAPPRPAGAAGRRRRARPARLRSRRRPALHRESLAGRLPPHRRLRLAGSLGAARLRKPRRHPRPRRRLLHSARRRCRQRGAGRAREPHRRPHPRALAAAGRVRPARSSATASGACSASSRRRGKRSRKSASTS